MNQTNGNKPVEGDSYTLICSRAAGKEGHPIIGRTTASSSTANHIARLQEQNRLLAECLADERQLRKQAYAWYQKRLKSRWLSMLEMFVAVVTDTMKNR
jgi:hypothetical protein